jgi:hypothetical protein
MEKNNCYIFWDDETVPEKDRKVYVQCEKCHAENKKGQLWSSVLLYGSREIKCNLCNTIIYKRLKKKKKKKGEDEATI